MVAASTGQQQMKQSTLEEATSHAQEQHTIVEFFSPQANLSPHLQFHILPFNQTHSIKFPLPWLKYDPHPEFIDERILFLNFAKEGFYFEDWYALGYAKDTDHAKDNKKMPNEQPSTASPTPIYASSEPDMTIWTVCMDSNIVKYTNRRLFEASLQMGTVSMRLMDTEKFKLIASTEDSSGASNFQVLYDGRRVDPPDVVLSRIGSKVNHFGLGVLFHLEKMGIQVLNGFEAHVATGDKLHQLQLLAQLSFPIPKSLVLGDPIGRSEDKMKILSTEFQFPIIMKKLKGMQGKGIIMVSDIDQFNDLEQIIDDTQPYLIQEYIHLSHGRDIRIFVVGGKTIGAMMRIAKDGFKSNFHLGGFVKQVKLNEKLEWLAIEAANHLGLDVAGVDILIDQNSYVVCEVNSSPGFMGLEAATGTDIASRILNWIQFKANIFDKKRVR